MPRCGTLSQPLGGLEAWLVRRRRSTGTGVTFTDGVTEDVKEAGCSLCHRLVWTSHPLGNDIPQPTPRLSHKLRHSSIHLEVDPILHTVGQFSGTCLLYTSDAADGQPSVQTA
eukprot:TRINITY_DN30945_c0_g1_i1.p2 TRINITY_DN30945_c0_g1~~TRINITY_DN30945_c0_g1_i1.p2  ORF type:complete len:113 (+),score=8.95 TRINITY_DN30945_c0_g1_i1:534-872(+)